MDNLTNGSIFDVISDYSELESLHINFGELKEIFLLPQIALPKLVEVRFRWFGQYFHPSQQFYPAINRFLEQSSKLKKLEISHHFDSITNVIISLKELRELKISFINELPFLLQSLNSHNMQYVNLDLGIKNRFDIDFINIISKYKNITALESTFRGLNKDNFILLLQNLPNIRMLHFKNKPKDLDDISRSKMTIIKTILEHSSQLSKLTFTLCHFKKCSFQQYPINDVDYYEVLNLVQNRVSSVKLTIEFVNYTNYNKKKLAIGIST